MPSVSRRLDELRAPDIERLLTDRSILVQPVGAIEQHGPHLPFNTDLLVADRVASTAVERVGEEFDVWLLPALAYTKSNEHAWSAGTIWLSASTLLAVLDDIGRCVATTAARKLVFMNGHGGNSALIGVANREIRLAHGLMTFLAHPGVPADQGGVSARRTELGMGIHGGTEETSLMLHLAPTSSTCRSATRNLPEHLADNRYVRFGGSVGFGWLSNDFGPDGHIGDPTTAHCRTRRAALRRRQWRRSAVRSPRSPGSRFPSSRRRAACRAARRARWSVMSMELSTDLRIDIDRLSARIAELAEIGRVDGPDGEWGSARLALTEHDRRGRDLVVTWMRDLGLAVAIDAIGNVFASRAGADPDAAAVMVGSHIDTVRTGGRFDGNLGVLAGLEVVETLARHGVVTERPLVVAFFTDEEGARFAPDMLGSLVYVGGMPIEEALDVVAVDDGAPAR